MKKTLIAGLLACLVGGGARGQAADPYAANYAARKIEVYRQSRDEILDKVRWAFFASGCKVLAEPSAGHLMTVLELILSHQYVVEVSNDSEVGKLFDAAVREGGARAKTEGCAFWRDNPNAVFEIREADRASYAFH